MPGISVMRTGIQARFLIALALFVVVFMALLGMALYVNQHNIMERRMLQDSHALTQLLYEKGNASAGFLARIAPQGILSYDYLLLEGYVEELSADSDIVYAVIFNAANQPVTHFLERGDPYFQTLGVAVKPENFSTVLRLVRKDPSLLIVRRPIDYQGSQLGMVEIGLSRARILQRTQELKANLQADLQRIAVITGILIFISLVALILLIEGTFRRLVVRPIQLLTAQMAQVQGGDLAVRAPVVREDEIGQLSQSFNRMAGDLQTQLNKIEEQRRAYKKTRDYLANILDNSTDRLEMHGTTDLPVPKSDEIDKLSNCMQQFGAVIEKSPANILLKSL